MTVSAAERVARYLWAMTMEITLLAKVCATSSVHHLEMEDLRALSLEAPVFTGVELTGIDRAFGVGRGPLASCRLSVVRDLSSVLAARVAVRGTDNAHLPRRHPNWPLRTRNPRTAARGGV